MKRFFYIFFASWVCVTIQAQDLDEVQPQNTRVKDRIKAARVGLITQRLNLTADQAQKFWPVYNEFDQKRTDLRKPLKEAQRNINPNNPDPKQQQALVDLSLKVKQDELNLEKEYSDKLKTVITAQQLLALHQAEHDFRSIIINMLNNRRGQFKKNDPRGKMRDDNN